MRLRTDDLVRPLYKSRNPLSCCRLLSLLQEAPFYRASGTPTRPRPVTEASARPRRFQLMQLEPSSHFELSKKRSWSLETWPCRALSAAPSQRLVVGLIDRILWKEYCSFARSTAAGRMQPRHLRLRLFTRYWERSIKLKMIESWVDAKRQANLVTQALPLPPSSAARFGCN